MKLGMIVRAENRGLGLQTWEAYRHLQPDRTLVVDLSHHQPYQAHFDRYPDAWQIVRDDRLTPEMWREFVAGLDVVFTAETPYDYRLYDIARRAGVATVCQVNPEFFRHEREPDLPRPTLLVAPTTWRLDRMPGVEHLPFPVDRERCVYRPRPAADGPVTFLHVAGHRAIYDRNGTSSVLQAIQHVTVPCRLIIRSQSDIGGALARRRSPTVDIQVHVEDVPDYWMLYDGADVLLLPRRYGGQSLPMNEALSCGLPVVATDVSPQNEWLPPATRVPARRRRRFQSQAGTLDLYDAHPGALGAAWSRLAGDRELVAKLSASADRYADSISWDTLRDRYCDTFARAIEMVRR